MDVQYLIRVMKEQPNLIRDLVASVSLEQARWKPEPDRWSILEVVNHLYDEEREDFRVRLEILLRSSDEPWPPIHPFAWITERRYNERELAPSLENFLTERRASLAWLRQLISPDWDAGVTTEWGTMRAGDMFASWVVHGQWHIEQLIRLRRDWTIAQVAPYKVDYAGTLD